MSIENNIVLTAASFGSIYLCAIALQEANKSKYNSIPYYCNYFILGFSAGIFVSIVKCSLNKI